MLLAGGRAPRATPVLGSDKLSLTGCASYHLRCGSIHSVPALLGQGGGAEAGWIWGVGGRRSGGGAAARKKDGM